MKLTRDAFCDLRHKAQQALRRSKETPLRADLRRHRLHCRRRAENL